MRNVEYSRAERTALGGLAVAGVFGVNGAFLFGVIHPEIVRAALGNPISLAFMTGALLLVIALAYLLTKWGVTRLPWTWLVLLLPLGSLAFPSPVAMLHGAERAQ